MTKKFLFGAVSSVSLLASMSAYAHDDAGWYLRANAGYGIHTDVDLSGGMTSEVHGNGLQSEGNSTFSGGVGYDLGNNWRLELDVDSLDTSLGSISQTPGSKGSMSTETLMLNALYDFSNFGKFEPYVGAGIGYVKGQADFSAHDYLNADGVMLRNPVCIGDRVDNEGVTCNISDSDKGFGWQLLAGLGYQISENLTWDTHYTYMNGPDLDLNGQFTNLVSNASSNFDAELSKVGTHAVVTGFRYAFGHKHVDAPKVVPPTPAPIADYKCWDGSMVFNAGQCPAEPAPEPVADVQCWDGSMVFSQAQCPAQPQPTTYTCWDGSLVYDLASCPSEPVAYTPNFNVCGSSPVAIFNVNTSATPKQMPRLGTLPEFGDSHGLTPSQFYDKLNARYNDNATDKAYLNYLFKSMGYANGWADAQPYMFSEEVLPVGTRGLLGLGKQHHYNYSILPTNERDRQAFRIQSANGSVVHFMKTCGNYMYACE